MQTYLWLADAITVAHAVLITVVLLGIPLSIALSRLRPIATVLLVGAMALWITFGACPLTILEDHLRRFAMQPRPLLAEGFIPYYLNQWFGVHLSNMAVTATTCGAIGFFLLFSSRRLRISVFKQSAPRAQDLS